MLDSAATGASGTAGVMEEIDRVLGGIEKLDCATRSRFRVEAKQGSELRGDLGICTEFGIEKEQHGLRVLRQV